MQLYKIILVILSFCITSIVVAEESVDDEKTRGIFSFALGQITIDNTRANDEGVEDTANYLRLFAEGQRNGWIYGGGLSAYFYSDNEAFKQSVINVVGSQSVADSSASATNVFLEVGYGFDITNSFSTDLLFGYEYVASSSRSIDNCSNCTSLDIKLEAGAYINPRLRYHHENGFEMSIFYLSFQSGDINNTVGLNVGWNLD